MKKKKMFALTHEAWPGLHPLALASSFVNSSHSGLSQACAPPNHRVFARAILSV